ncbi:MAG: hypothetical protein ACKO0W_12970, partial [Planctomycetota bacterium]
MKLVWTIVALLLLGGIIVIFQPPAAERDALTGIIADQRAAPEPPRAPEEERPAPPATETSLASSQPTATAATTAPTTPTPVAPTATTEGQPTPATTPAPAANPDGAKPEPSAEKPVDPKLLEDASAFSPEIPAVPHAEVTPSKFLRLSDGSISVDDAWTVRGDGSAAAPYEVSWEFLSSAQDSYVPRLGEAKIPARIAFLSGKHVRISGYLAFPLIAPTASECLVMLNQWDGCCIGIPPTPYDAIEVRLATEM